MYQFEQNNSNENLSNSDLKLSEEQQNNEYLKINTNSILISSKNNQQNVENCSQGNTNQKHNGNLQIQQIYKYNFRQVNQQYNPKIKMLTITKSIFDQYESSEEIFILQQLQNTDITLKLISSENNKLEQICGIKDFYRVKLDCMPFILKSKQFNEMYDSFIAIQYIRLIQKLQLLHKKGYAHSDIKPQNIVMGYDSQPYFIDLGVSKLLSNYTDYLESYTESYNLLRYYKFDQSETRNQKYLFQDENQVIFCEFVQLSLTILSMIIPEFTENILMFKYGKQFYELIEIYSPQFPQTTQLLKIMTKQYLDVNNAWVLPDSLNMIIDYSHINQVMMKIIDIQYNTQQSKFIVKRINKDSLSLIQLIDNNFSNIDFSQNQIDIVPFQQSPSYYNLLLQKYSIKPSMNDKNNKYSFGFGQFSNSFNLKEYLKSTQSKNSSLRIGINSDGDMKMVLQNLNYSSEYLNIRLNICFINLFLVRQFLQEITANQKFTLESIEIYFIQEMIIQLNFKQKQHSQVESADLPQQQIQTQNYQNDVQQNQIDQDIKTNCLDQINKIILNQNQSQLHESHKHQIKDSNQHKIQVDQQPYLPIIFKNYLPFRGQIKEAHYRELNFLQDIQKPLYSRLKISNQRDFVSNFYSTSIDILKEYLKQDLEQINSCFNNQLNSIYIKYILRSNYEGLFSNEQLKKYKANTFEIIQSHQHTNQYFHQKIKQDDINQMMILQNIECELYHVKINQFEDILNKLLKMMTHQIDHLLNKKFNHLNNQCGKLTITFSHLVINNYIYQIIMHYFANYYDESHYINIIFSDCYYDQETLISLIHLDNQYSIKFNFHQKLVNKEQNSMYSIKFDYFKQQVNKTTDKINFFFIKTQYQETINDNSKQEINDTQNSDLYKFKNDNIKLEDIVNIFRQNNLFQVLNNIKDLVGINAVDKKIPINYQIINVNPINLQYHQTQLEGLESASCNINYLQINPFQYEISRRNIIQKLNNNHKSNTSEIIKQSIDQFNQQCGDELSLKIYDIIDKSQQSNKDHDLKIDIEQQLTQTIKQLFYISKEFSISQDKYSFEIQIISDQINYFQLEEVIWNFLNYFSLKKVLNLKRFYLKYIGNIDNNQIISKQFNFSQIDIELVVLDLSDCKIECLNDHLTQLIANIKCQNIYIYLPFVIYSNGIINTLKISSSQNKQKIFFNSKQPIYGEEFYGMFRDILQQKPPHFIQFIIKTKQTQKVLRLFKNPKDYYINQQIFYQIDNKLVDGLIVTYKGQIHRQNDQCEFYFHYQIDEWYTDQEIIQDHPRQTNIQINPQDLKNYLPISVTYEGYSQLSTQQQKNYLMLNPLITNEIENDLEYFILQKIQDHQKQELIILRDTFNDGQSKSQQNNEQINISDIQGNPNPQQSSNHINNGIEHKPKLIFQRKGDKQQRELRQLKKVQGICEIERFNEEFLQEERQYIRNKYQHLNSYEIKEQQYLSTYQRENKQL